MGAPSFFHSERCLDNLPLTQDIGFEWESNSQGSDEHIFREHGSIHSSGKSSEFS